MSTSILLWLVCLHCCNTIVLRGFWFSQHVSLHCPFNALHQLLNFLRMRINPQSNTPPVLSTALNMADDSSRQLLETLASCLEALQKLSEALLPSLTKQIRSSQGEEANGSAEPNVNVVNHVSSENFVNTNSNVSRGNEAIINSNQAPSSGANSWQDDEAVNSGAISRCGNEATNHRGNEAIYRTSNEANRRGNEATNNGDAYGAGNSYSQEYYGGHSFNNYDHSSWPGWNYYGNEANYYPYFPSFNQQWTPPWNPPVNARHQCWPPNNPAHPAQSVTQPIQSQSEEGTGHPHSQPSTHLGKRTREQADDYDNSSEDEISLEVLADERRELCGDGDSTEDEALTEPATKKRFVPSKELLESLNDYTARPLKNDDRKKALSKFPTLSCDAGHLLKLNDTMEQLLPQRAKSFDSYLSKLQRFTTDAMAPIAWLREQMVWGEADEESAKNALDTALQLLGNASAHFNMERRKEVMKHLNSDLKCLAIKEFPQGGSSLFGEDFGSKAKAAADNMRALKGIQSNKNRFFGYSGSKRRTKSTPQSHRPNWGVSRTPNKSVFNRLGKAHYPKSQGHKQFNPAFPKNLSKQT